MLLATVIGILLISTVRSQLFDTNLDYFAQDSIEPQLSARKPVSYSDFKDFPADCLYDAPSTPMKLPEFATEFEFMQRRIKWSSLPQDLATPATRKYYVAVMFSALKKRGVFVYEDDLNHTQQRYRSIDVFNASQAFDVDTVGNTCVVADIPKSVTCSPYMYYLEAGYRTKWANAACVYAATPLIPINTDSFDAFAPSADQLRPYTVAFKQCVRVQHESSAKPSFWLNQYYYNNKITGLRTGEVKINVLPLKVVITSLDPENHIVGQDNMPMTKQVYDFLAYRPYIKRYEDFEPPNGVCCVAPNVTLCNNAVPAKENSADATQVTPTAAVICDGSDDDYYFVQEYPVLTMLVAILMLPTIALLLGFAVVSYRKKRLEQLRIRQRVWMVTHIIGNEQKI